MVDNQTLFTEDFLLPLSALQHVVSCARWCARIRVEQVCPVGQNCLNSRENAFVKAP